ncbi:MAG: NAD-dependent epimerase/dehydratase family protein [Rhodospirillales bacterium]|nr:NAD-dependent epimerase/dehydratase family protein [Rhodospirillales bacterium]
MSEIATAGEVWTLVTGGAGFIGSHTVDALIEAGERVVVFDDFSTGSRLNLSRWAGCERLRTIEADVCDGLFAPLLHAFEGQTPRIHKIIHLAAQTSVVNSMRNPLQDIRNNYIGTAHVLEFARATSVGSVVFSSSSSVYCGDNTFPIAEDATQLPVSPYAVNKLACEHLIRMYAQSYGLRATILRFFNVFGPRQRASNPYSGVISIFCERAMHNQPLTIHGDGSQTRDFVFVTDVATAICAAAMSAGARGAIINIGTGSETRILDLATTIIDIAGARSEIRFAARQLGSIDRSVAAIDRARALLGFRPKIDLRRGIEATLAWRTALPEAA